jgi:hypothetical protein
MLKGPAVNGFNCCSVPAIRNLYSFVFVLYMHVIRVILPGEVK